MIKNQHEIYLNKLKSIHSNESMAKEREAIEKAVLFWKYAAWPTFFIICFVAYIICGHFSDYVTRTNVLDLEQNSMLAKATEWVLTLLFGISLVGLFMSFLNHEISRSNESLLWFSPLDGKGAEEVLEIIGKHPELNDFRISITKKRTLTNGDLFVLKHKAQKIEELEIKNKAIKKENEAIKKANELLELANKTE